MKPHNEATPCAPPGSAPANDVAAIVAGMLKRNPQLAHHVGKEVSLEEFALAVVIQYQARTYEWKSPNAGDEPQSRAEKPL